jgi:putative membrane protein
MAWMGLWWIVGLGVLVLFVWAIARAASVSAAPAGREDSPETILKRRYARGEIEHDEYERRLGDLRK